MPNRILIRDTVLMPQAVALSSFYTPSRPCSGMSTYVFVKMPALPLSGAGGSIARWRALAKRCAALPSSGTSGSIALRLQLGNMLQSRRHALHDCDHGQQLQGWLNNVRHCCGRTGLLLPRVAKPMQHRTDPGGVTLAVLCPVKFSARGASFHT